MTLRKLCTELTYVLGIAKPTDLIEGEIKKHIALTKAMIVLVELDKKIQEMDL